MKAGENVIYCYRSEFDNGTDFLRLEYTDSTILNR